MKKARCKPGSVQQICNLCTNRRGKNGCVLSHVAAVHVEWDAGKAECNSFKEKSRLRKSAGGLDEI